MLIPEIMGLLSPIFSFISTAFMIWMIVDCLKNPRLVHKVGWVFFIFFTQFIGAAVYFFTRGPWPKVKQYLFPNRSFSSYNYPYPSGPQATPMPQPTQDIYAPYEQGYRAQQQNPVVVPQELEDTSQVPSVPAQYEEPLIMYPEPPQE